MGKSASAREKIVDMAIELAESSDWEAVRLARIRLDMRARLVVPHWIRSDHRLRHSDDSDVDVLRVVVSRDRRSGGRAARARSSSRAMQDVSPWIGERSRTTEGPANLRSVRNGQRMDALPWLRSEA